MSQPGCTLVESGPSPRSLEKLRSESLRRKVLGAMSPLKSRENHPYLDSRTVGTALYWTSHMNNAKGWCKQVNQERKWMAYENNFKSNNSYFVILLFWFILQIITSKWKGFGGNFMFVKERVLD